MKKHLILFFPSKDPVTSAFDLLREKMALRENQMLEEIPQERVDIYMVRSRNNFFGKNEFLPQFQLIGKIWETYTGIEHIFGDLVYGFNMGEGVTHTRSSDIKDITRDKRVLAEIFPQYALPSIVCQNYEDISKNFTHISTQLKVLKPCFGSRSKGIFIREKIPEKGEIPEEHYPYILQEFFDTSEGFYGNPGFHDFRIVIQGGEIVGAYLRQPENGKYTSNSYARGNFIDYTEKHIPKEILQIVQEIDDYWAKIDIHRYYSIDMGIGNNRNIKVFEMNSAPGLTTEYLARKFGQYTAKHILQVS